MAPTRKLHRRTVPAKIDAKSKGAKRLSVKAPLSRAKPTRSTELRRTQAELEAARGRYVELYDFSPAGHLTLDMHGTIMEANLRAGKLLGINRNELIGQSFARFISSDDRDLFTGIVRRCCRQARDKPVRCVSGKRQTSRAALYFESLAVHDETGQYHPLADGPAGHHRTQAS